MKKLLILLSILLFFGSANALQIQPSELTIEGEKGEFVLQTVTLFNDYNTPVNVTITTSNLNCFLPVTTVTLQPFGVYQLPIGFYLNESKKGFIIYQCETNFVYQLVDLQVQKHEPKLIMYPENPKAGDTIAILLMNDELVDAHGFILCTASGRVYQVIVTDGIGIVKLNESEPSGVAILRIVGEGISPIYTTFNITEKEETQNYIAISAPASRQAWDTVTATVLYNGEPVVADVDITSPSGKIMHTKSDSNGKITFKVNEVGRWTIYAIKGSVDATAYIDVSKRNVGITYFPMDVSVNEKCTIYLPSNDFEVFCNGEKLNVVGDKAYWTPTDGGTYTIVAYNETAQGSIDIDVKENTIIRVKDEDGYLQEPYKVFKMSNVMFELTDSSGDRVQGMLRVTGNGINMNVNSWSYYKIKKAGTYTIYYDGDMTHEPSSVTITVVGREVGGNWTWAIVAIALVIVVIVGYKYRGKIKDWIESRGFDGTIYDDKG